jgi:hypothetical protein
MSRRPITIARWRSGAQATGQPLTRLDAHPDYHGAALHGQEIGLLIQRLGHGQGRLHLDIHTDDPAAEIARLEQLGAERVQQVHSWWIMRDPAGRAPIREEYLIGNARGLAGAPPTPTAGAPDRIPPPAGRARPGSNGPGRADSPAGQPRSSAANMPGS